MFKQIITLVVLSVLTILAMSYAQQALTLLVHAHQLIVDGLSEIFSGGEGGVISRDLIALLLLPVLVGLIPALVYWIATRKWFPYFMHFVWVTWLLQTAALVILFK